MMQKTTERVMLNCHLLVCYARVPAQMPMACSNPSHGRWPHNVCIDFSEIMLQHHRILHASIGLPDSAAAVVAQVPAGGWRRRNPPASTQRFPRLAERAMTSGQILPLMQSSLSIPPTGASTLYRRLSFPLHLLVVVMGTILSAQVVVKVTVLPIQSTTRQPTSSQAQTPLAICACQSKPNMCACHNGTPCQQ